MKNTLQTAMREAMKAKDKSRLQTIRGLLSALQYEALQRGEKELSEGVCLEVLQREAKKKRETLDFAEKGGRDAMVVEIKAQIATIEGFLPQQMSEAELRQLLNTWKAASRVANIGEVMKALKADHAGTYDPRMASALAKEMFK